MAQKVAGDLYESITGQLFEIGRQLRQPSGYPFEAERLQIHLQRAVEGRFPKVLQLVMTVPVTGGDRFVVMDRFHVDTQEAAPIQFSWIGKRFRARFRNLVEEPCGEAVLRVHQLSEMAALNSVMGQLGGYGTAVIMLQQLMALIAGQGRGQQGPLLTDGNPNYAFVRSEWSGPYTVSVTWDTDEGGWLINEFSGDKWLSEGTQVISL